MPCLGLNYGHVVFFNFFSLPFLDSSVKYKLCKYNEYLFGAAPFTSVVLTIHKSCHPSSSLQLLRSLCFVVDSGGHGPVPAGCLSSAAVASGC